jgi:epsilon-lactone hydrolase
MSRLQLLMSVLPTVAVTAARTALRRARHGPLHPDWSYALEMQVAFLAVMLGIDSLLKEGGIQRMRSIMEALSPPGPSLREVERTRVDAGGVPAIQVMPRAGARGTVLYFHGGGYVVGSPETHRESTARLAVDTGMRVLVPDYRLAPEHPYPAALEDALAAWRWLRSTGVEASRVVVGGDSAGGGLALALLVALVEAGEPLPAGGLLLSPWLDLACTAKSHVEHVRYDFLTPESLRACGRLYAGTLELTDPRVSPLYASFRGLPPLHIQVGGTELFRDPICELAERVRAEGVPVTLEVCEGVPHVPFQFVTMSQRARESSERLLAAVRRMMEGAGPVEAPAKAAG